MNILKGNILKGFAAVAMLCMIGTVLAESVAVGDIGLAVAQAVKMETGKSPNSTSIYENSVSLGKMGAGIGATYGLRCGIRFAVRGAVIGASAGPEGAVAGAIVGFTVGAA